MTRWFDGIDPVTVRVRCGDDVHRVTWRRGRLVLEDHNLTAERSLAALGGENCPCVEVLAAWLGGSETVGDLMYLWPLSLTADVDDREVAVVSRRHPFRVPPGVPPDVLAQIQARERQARLRDLGWALPPQLFNRLVLGAVIGWDRRWHDLPGDECAAATKYLLPEASHAVRQSISCWRRLDPGARFDIGAAIVGPEERRSVRGRVDHRLARVHVEVSLSWLVTVWAKGLAVVDGCFVLDVGGGPDTLAATVVRWERMTACISEPVAVPAIIRRDPQGSWRLRLTDRQDTGGARRPAALSGARGGTAPPSSRRGGRRQQRR